MHLAVRGVENAKGGCSPPTPGDPVSIPHDVENRGVATGINQQLNPQVSGPSRVPPQVTESRGATSQGGDTGSNPVGTADANLQVTGQVWDEVQSEQAPAWPADPAAIPREVSTRRRRCRPGDTGACLSFRVLSHHPQESAGLISVSTCSGWRHATSITRSRIAGFDSASVGDLVGASPATDGPGGASGQR